MLNAQRKRELANKLIDYVKEHYNSDGVVELTRPNWWDTNKMLDHAAEFLHEHKYDLWQVHALLRDLGRIELNCPNGRKGGHLANDTPVELPLITERKCNPHRCPIVTAVFKTFPDICKE